MTTPTTPYALFQHVSLSECRKWRERADTMTFTHSARIADELWHLAIQAKWNERALAAVTAERDALRAQLDAMTGEL